MKPALARLAPIGALTARVLWNSEAKIAISFI
jgi:hypothetical protein